MATWNRPKSLKMTIESLFDSDLSLCDRIYVNDDCSTNKEQLSYLKELGERDKVTVYSQPTQIGVQENMCMCMAESDKDYVVIIGDDTLFNHEWLNKLDWLRNRAEIYGDWGALTVANFPNHPATKVIEENIIQKESIGSFSAMYKMNMVRMMLDEMEVDSSKLPPDNKYCYKTWPVLIVETLNTEPKYVTSDIMRIMWHTSYDWVYQKQCVKRGLPIYSTQKSYTYHLNYKNKKSLHHHTQVKDFVE